MTVTNIVQDYKRYVVKRNSIKARQRAELEKELEDYSYELGRDFVELKADGHRVEDIAAMIGLKNRTFLYKMEAVFTARQSQSEAPEPDEQPEPQYAINIDSDKHVAVVGWDGNPVADYVQLDEDNKVVTMPDSWVNELDPKVRKLYREIVQEINNAN